MAYQTVQVTVGSWTASVAIDDVANPSLVPTVLATATIDVNGVTVTAQKTWTMGPTDGGLGAVPDDYVQTGLDALRQQVARICAMRANVEQQKQAAQ